MNASKDSLEQLRQRIDRLDDQMVDLLGERFELIAGIAELKKQSGGAAYQPEREDEILKRVVARGKALGLDGLLLQAIFLQVFAVSKRRQQDS